MLPALPDAVDPAGLKRALVVKLRHQGDVLLASPVFSALKRHAPQLEIDALVYDDTRDMVTGHPALSQVFCVERRWRSLGPIARVAEEWRLFQGLRRRRYDLLIHLSEHPRGAWLARALGCRYSVAPDYSDRSRFWARSFTHRVALPKNARRHMVERNLDALRRIGIYPEPGERRLLLVPGREGEAEAARLMAEHGLPAKGFVHVHPASRWSFKCWSIERNAALIGALARRGERVALTCAPDPAERGFVAEIVARCAARPADLSGRLSLKGLAALTAQAKLFIGVDSAPMHMACAMGTPVVALFGPSGEHEWGPWGADSRVVASESHPCRPCGIDGCGGGKLSDCLVGLPETRVLEAVDALLPS